LLEFGKGEVDGRYSCGSARSTKPRE